MKTTKELEIEAEEASMFNKALSMKFADLCLDYIGEEISENAFRRGLSEIIASKWQK